MLNEKNAAANTSEMETSQSWELVWQELEHVGIVRGAPGPVEGGIACGHNAERAIRSLQQGELSFLQVANIGLLIQAAIRAAELNRLPARTDRRG